MANNKIIYGGKVLIDLTSDTVTPDTLLSGVTAHSKSGDTIEGSCTFDVDSAGATVAEAEILSGKTAYARGAKLTGTMKNNGAFKASISNVSDSIVIPIGYHDGSGNVGIDVTEKAKLISANIKQGVSVLCITGTLKPSSSVTAQEKTVTPTTKKQTVLPDSGTDYLSQVVINAIPYVESSNSAGGTTITIGG